MVCLPRSHDGNGRTVIFSDFLELEEEMVVLVVAYSLKVACNKMTPNFIVIVLIKLKEISYYFFGLMRLGFLYKYMERIEQKKSAIFVVQ